MAQLLPRLLKVIHCLHFRASQAEAQITPTMQAAAGQHGLLLSTDRSWKIHRIICESIRKLRYEPGELNPKAWQAPPGRDGTQEILYPWQSMKVAAINESMKKKPEI